jgi:hypothetical protein
VIDRTHTGLLMNRPRVEATAFVGAPHESYADRPRQ